MINRDEVVGLLKALRFAVGEDLGNIQLTDWDCSMLDRLEDALRSLESAEPVAYGLKNAITGEWCGTAFVPTKDAEGYDHDALLPLYTTPQPAKVQVPTGWKLVPTSSTREMHRAADMTSDPWTVWEQMCTAAPNPPQETGAARATNDITCECGSQPRETYSVEDDAGVSAWKLADRCSDCLEPHPPQED